jgi:hypothetical protein
VVNYPRRRLNPKLVAASRNCILQQQKQARLAGWATLANFSRDLHSPGLAYTPLLRERFARLAQLVMIHIDSPGEEVWLPEAEQ